MLVIRLWNYFRGYVIIKIEGLTLERFLNLVISKGIYLWDVKSIDYTTLEARIGVKGFKELRDVVRRVGCRVTIVQKRGYPFLVHKMKYRKMLALGAIIALGIVFFLTSFIWSIEIIGNETIGEEALLSYLHTLGVRPWVYKKSINTIDIKKKILYDIDKLSFAHIDINGTKLTLEVKEKKDILEEVERDIPCNIVASKKAVIEKVIARSGHSIVEKGDIVRAGDILITGRIKDERIEEPLLVHAEGTVLGITSHTKTMHEPIYKTIKKETGREYTSREIQFFNKSLHLINGEIPFENYIEKRDIKKIFNNRRFESPIEIIIHRYKEVTLERVEQTIKALKESTAVKGVQMIMKELPEGASVIGKEIQYEIQDDVLITRIHIETIEEIGEKREIEYTEED